MWPNTRSTTASCTKWIGLHVTGLTMSPSISHCVTQESCSSPPVRTLTRPRRACCCTASCHRSQSSIHGTTVKGLTQKAAQGGTINRAPIGYVNIGVRDERGRESRTVEIDEERARHITWRSRYTLQAVGRSLKFIANSSPADSPHCQLRSAPRNRSRSRPCTGCCRTRTTRAM